MIYDFQNPTRQIFILADERDYAMDRELDRMGGASIVCVRTVDLKGRGCNTWLSLRRTIHNKIEARMNSGTPSRDTSRYISLRPWIDHDGDAAKDETPASQSYREAPQVRVDGGRATLNMSAADALTLAGILAEYANGNAAVADKANPATPPGAVAIVRDLATLAADVADKLRREVTRR